VQQRSLIASVVAALVAFATTARATPEIWIEDDGTLVSPLATPPRPASRTTSTIDLFALRDETVAFQVAIRAGSLPLDGVAVEILPPSIETERSLDVSWTERFVVHSIRAIAPTRNGWSNHEETLAWATPSATPPEAPVWIPDALLPVDHAPAWAPYPLRLPRHRTGSVWVDIHVPKDAEDGHHGASVVVRTNERTLATIPLSLEVKGARLPFKAARTAVFYDPAMLDERIGEGSSEAKLWRLFHRHHLTPMLSAYDVESLHRLRPAIDGSAFRADDGYRGPGEARGNDVLVLGTYGVFGEPSRAALAKVRALTAEIERIPTSLSVFLYAIDEQCESDRAARWRKLLRSSGDPALYGLRVAESCHQFPVGRAADVVLIPSAAFRTDEADEARSSGKWLWVYNGHRPRSGPLMLDASPLDLRVNGWIASAFDVDRWFYWESIFWNDSNSGGRGPVDPFATADSFHNFSGDVALGDGLLVYPGRQIQFPEHSVGTDDVFPSIRLKNLRRGIQDAGYVALAASQSPELAERIVRSVLPRALDEVPSLHTPAAWPDDAARFLAARRALWLAIPSRLELDDDDVRHSLAAVARLRRERVDRSPEAPDSKLAVAIVAGAAGAWILRRSSVIWRRPKRRRWGAGG